MYSCPSCAAPLDEDGICPACGALSRGFFGKLDLGRPQIALAVTRGLDFYRLLNVASDADIRTIARRYRQLRVLFPDDPRHLAAEPARKLSLLEHAGRVLTDPNLRQIYDELRARPHGDMAIAVMRCSACSAPLPPETSSCSYCGTPRPPEHAAPLAPPPEPGPPAAEPIDYYAMLGLTPNHLGQDNDSPLQIDPVARRLIGPASAALQNQKNEAPSVSDIDLAALTRQREVLLNSKLPAEGREARADEYEVARRILRKESRRARYDALLVAFRQGKLAGGRLDSLRQLQDEVRAEIAEERGIPLAAPEAEALLQQSLGYLEAGMPREASGLLRQIVIALPEDPRAHIAYVRALINSGDPLDLGAHALRQVLNSVEKAESSGSAIEGGPAISALCRGLLARDAGDTKTAEIELQHSARLDPQLGAAWRALMALALTRGAIEDGLSYCRRALAINRRDERALTMAVAGCLRAGRRDNAYDFAAQIAAIRGNGWTAEKVLAELGF